MTNQNNFKKTLVTGATGFVGSHLVRRLVSEKREVSLIIRPESKLDLIRDIENGVTLYRHDGSMDHMNAIIEKVRPDIVFHLASFFIVQHHADDIKDLVQSNILFGTQVVEAMTARGVYHLVNTGTSWQHYENQAYSPVNLYAATKEAFETVLKYYTETTRLKVITLKLFDTYGPNDPRPKLFALLQKAATQKEPLAMSQGKQLIDLVYIDDVVEAFIVAAERLREGKVKQTEEFAVSSGKSIKLKDLVEMYGQITGENLPIQWGGRPYRPREVMIPWNKEIPLPGWTPKISLESGITRVFQERK